MAQSSLPQNVAVIIRISEGTFTDGFSVELHILEDGLLIDKDANLPRIAAAPEISQCYKEWKLTYHALGRALGGRMLRKVHVQATHQSSVETCRRKTQEFETKVKNWLSSSTFSLLRDRIQANVRMAANQSVPIILDCATGILEQDILLRKLPWHTWDLFDRLNYAEVVLSTCFTRPTLSLRSPVKTLAIFGSDEGGLKLEEDITALKELERSGPEILPRVQPDREKLSEWLYGESWDILFFAGHSL